MGSGIEGRRGAGVNPFYYRAATSHPLQARNVRTTEDPDLLWETFRGEDGNSEDRSDTVSVFNGPPPTICSFTTETEEIDAVSKWFAERLQEGVLPHELGVFVRSAAQIDRARAAVQKSKVPFRILDEHVETATGQVSICTMHLAKGLEFRAVVVMACDDEVIPLQERIEMVGDDADLKEVYDTERHLLYVACTRARDNLLVTSVEPRSEFLDDMSK
jgi:superfamily I DNA/RNA helicase